MKPLPVRVLLIEDNPADADLLRALLAGESSPTFALACVSRLEEGLAHLGRCDIDVVLLDLSLPDSQGFDTVAAVINQAPSSPIVVLTGLDDETVALEAVRRGAQDYLVKGEVNGKMLSHVMRYAIERKRAAEALKESEERFRQLGENVREVFWMYDPQITKTIYISPAYEEIWGRTCESRYEKPRSFLDAVHPQDRARVEAALRKLPLGEYEVEYRVVRPDGSIRWVWDHGFPIRDEHGQVYRVGGTAADVTERKRAEEALARQARALARSNAELEQFVYVASHDLQQPLRKMATFAELLAKRYRGQLGASADRYIGYIVDGAFRMHTLINDLLVYSRSGREDVPFERTNVTQVMQHALADLEAAIRESGAVVTCGTLPTIRANPSQLRQVLQNLIENGLKFHGEAPPRVHVAAEHRDHEWLFSVRDNGVGVDARNAERIFVMFQRLRGTKGIPGTGIGLAICKRIVERHGGRIWVESQSGKGATFYFTVAEKGGDHAR